LEGYGIILIACVLVGALAMLMTGATSRDPEPMPILLDDQADRAAPVTTPARPVRRVVRPRRRRASVAPDDAGARREGIETSAAAGEGEPSAIAPAPRASDPLPARCGGDDRAAGHAAPAGAANDGGGKDVVESGDDAGEAPEDDD
jgi:hypothetical protein